MLPGMTSRKCFSLMMLMILHSIGYAFTHKLRADLDIVIRYKIVVSMDSCFVIIGIGGNTVLYFEEIIGISIDIRFRCGSQTDHKLNDIFFKENDRTFGE